MIRWCLAFWLLAMASPAWAGTVRFGVFAGNDSGKDGQVELKFATSDARKMRDLFVSWGQIRTDHAHLLQDQSRSKLFLSLASVKKSIDEEKAAGNRTELVFYYSGHGDEKGLQLGSSLVSHDDLRQWLEATGADFRIAFLDACRSGAAIRSKGGVRGPSYAFVLGLDQVEGTAIVTSSAAAEYAQESDEIGGGFFTHYLHTALLGAADANTDGEVTLSETYAWVHSETAFESRNTAGTQTPSFEFELSGSGEFALTRLEKESASIRFPGGIDGTLSVWDEERKRYVAEVNGTLPTKIAVRPGEYYVHRRMPGWVDEAVYAIDAGENAQVAEGDLSARPYEDTASRGDLARQIRRASMPNLSFHLLAGGRGFGANSIYQRQYLPAHAVFGVEWRQRTRYFLYWGLDVLGGQGKGELTFDELGSADVLVSSFSAAGNVGYSPSFKVFTFGVGLRTELIVFSRSFVHMDEPTQTTVAPAPGGSLWVGFKVGHFSADLCLNGMILPVQWDESGFPSYGEFLLRAGYQL